MIATATNSETLGTARTVIKDYYVLLKLIRAVDGMYRTGHGLGNLEIQKGHGVVIYRLS